MERVHLSPFPQRHGINPTRTEPLARTLGWFCAADQLRKPQRWRAVGDGLMRGDPAADRVVAWAHEYGMASAHALIQQAIAGPVSAHAALPPPLRDFMQMVTATPAWLRPELLERGALACHRAGMPGFYALRDLALMGGYRLAAINQTLIATGELARGARRRLANTVKWQIDCTEPGGLAYGQPGFRSTLQVRVLHAMVRRRVQRQPDWSTETWGLPVNQTDMLGTYLGFSVLFLLGQRFLGVPVRDDDAQAVMHLWKYIAWLMGVDEDLLVDDELEGRALLHDLLLAQAPADESSLLLGRALMDEPMARHYRWLPTWRRRFERARHLSLNRYFLGRRGMRELGLPQGVWPWFPLLSIPYTTVRHRMLRRLPGGNAYLERSGREAQRAMLPVMGIASD
jgi:hypothetical protein